MRPGWTVGFACAAALPMVAFGTQPLAQAPRFRAATDAVVVHATVQDATGRLVPDLDRSDFRLRVDNEPATITHFSTDPQPLSVALMIDTSQVAGHGLGSPHVEERERTYEALRAFVLALREQDRVRVGTFGLEIAVGANLTRDWNEVARVLREEVWLGGGTPLWQALVAGMESVADEPGRRVVLALTNGIDTGRVPGFAGRRSNVEDYALRTHAMLYAVRLGSAGHWDRMADELARLTVATGGGFFDSTLDGDLQDTFTRLAEELRHQYLIGFVPSALDGKVHQIDITAADPGLTVRSRRTFVASGPAR